MYNFYIKLYFYLKLLVYKDIKDISNKIEDNTVKSIIKKDVSKVSIIGNGIIRNYSLIGKIIEYLKDKNFDILKLEITEMKISIIFKNIIEDESLQEIHKLIFWNCSK